MNLLEETQFRLACCIINTGDGWGEARSLRNHLQGPVANRLAKLKPLVDEIKALPEGHELRRDYTVGYFLQEYRDLLQAQILANDHLDIVEEIAPPDHPETKAEEIGRLQACLRKLGIPV